MGHTFGVRVDGTSSRRFLRFLSLTGLWPRGLWIALRAILIKSALRDWLSVSYGMIRILVIGSLRSPPKGENAEMVREVYDSLFFSLISLVSP